MHWMAEVIHAEAGENNLIVGDLSNAVSAVRDSRAGRRASARMYKDLVEDDTADLWDVAVRVANYFEEKEKTSHTAK